jgi:N-acetylmuramoyl-L-alanine amidase
MTNKIVTVTSGHSNVGKIDSGAVTTVDGKLVKEADIAVKLRNAILHYLQKDKEITTRCDGYGSVNLELKEAIKLIKGSDVSLEIHTNASANKTANGVECIALPKDKVLAQKLSAAVSKITGSRLRGDKGYITQEDSARGKLGYVSNGGLILEVFFISNDSELEVFDEKYWLIAKSIAEVLIDYVKNKK